MRKKPFFNQDAAVSGGTPISKICNSIRDYCDARKYNPTLLDEIYTSMHSERIGLEKLSVKKEHKQLIKQHKERKDKS